MPDNHVDIYSIDAGLVTAPAGCGKTHLICKALARHKDAKPVLLLTHTNAGVAALRSRLNRFGVSPRAYRLSTLDGIAMRLVGIFPKRSGVNPDVLRLDNPRTDYPDIRSAACKLLSEGHVHDIFRATYSRLIVDEYQDCCVDQHLFVSDVALALPTCVLGDPLQAVFEWLGLPDWNAVRDRFPDAGELTTPWRWLNAGAEDFGRWLLEVRRKLLHREAVDFAESPEEVSWVYLDDTVGCHQCQLQAARTRAPSSEGTVLIIADSKKPDEQRKFASQTPGAVTVESVDLRDLISFARSLDFASPDALYKLIDFASDVMRNVGAANLVKRIESLERGTARREATDVENAALNFKRDPSPNAAIDLLVEINKDIGVTSHRPAVLRACIKSLKSCGCDGGASFYEAAVCAREQNRLLGRSLPKRAVGSTLLLKGLEADVSVVLNASIHSAKSLYVAITRGSQRLVICSRNPVWSQY